MNQSATKNIHQLIFYNKFTEATPIMEKEIVSFIEQYMNGVHSHLFWENCKTEIPY